MVKKYEASSDRKAIKTQGCVHIQKWTEEWVGRNIQEDEKFNNNEPSFIKLHIAAVYMYANN